MNSEKFKDFLRRYKWTVCFVLGGLLLTILLLTIGFWRTLLLTVIVSVCFFIGLVLDRNAVDSVRAFFKKLFAKDTNQ